MAKYMRQFNHYNQRLLDAAGKNHGHCMDTVLGYHAGNPKAAARYTAHNIVRYLYVIECCRSAMDEQADRMNQHTVVYPIIERLRRERESALRSKS